MDPTNIPNPSGSPIEKLLFQRRRLWTPDSLGKFLRDEGVPEDLATSAARAFSRLERESRHEFKQFIEEFQYWSNTHTHPGGTGPVPVNPVDLYGNYLFAISGSTYRQKADITDPLVWAEEGGYKEDSILYSATDSAHIIGTHDQDIRYTFDDFAVVSSVTKSGWTPFASRPILDIIQLPSGVWLACGSADSAQKGFITKAPSLTGAWTKQTLPSPGLYCRSLFLRSDGQVISLGLVSVSGNRGLISADEGDTWTALASVGFNTRDIAFDGTTLIAATNTSGAIAHSPDEGDSWSFVTVFGPDLSEVYGIANDGAGKWVAGGGVGGSKGTIAYSTAAVPGASGDWTEVVIHTDVIQSVHHYKGIGWYAIGSNKALFFSEDGITWSNKWPASATGTVLTRLLEVADRGNSA